MGNLDWHYNNTLNQLTKVDKSNTTQYSVYDYQGNPLCVVFVVFTQNVSANVQGIALLFCFIG
jgi:hypothetical protein